MQWLSQLYAQWQGKVQALGVMLPPFDSFWNAPTTEIPGWPGRRHVLAVSSGSGGITAAHRVRQDRDLLRACRRLQDSRLPWISSLDRAAGMAGGPDR